MRLADLQSYDTTWRGFVPGMLSEDQPLWYAWLNDHVEDFDRLYYNVELPIPETLPLDTDPKYAALWKSLTARRVDVVGVQATTRTVIEVATRLQPANIGRVIAYEELWKQQVTDGQISRTLILYDLGTSIDILTAQRAGFDIEHVATRSTG